MSKPVRYKDGTVIMPGTEAMELYESKAKDASKKLEKHMKALDATWRKHEGRKPVDQLTEHEKMLEGLVPFNGELASIRASQERNRKATLIRMGMAKEAHLQNK